LPGVEPPEPGREPGPSRARRRAREDALRTLYRWEVVGEDLGGLAAELERVSTQPEAVTSYAVHLVSLVATGREEIDGVLGEALARWDLSRLAVIDRSILRVGTAELIFSADVPTPVILNESIEIAKKYGSAQSGGFVNGVLDRVAKITRSEETR